MVSEIESVSIDFDSIAKPISCDRPTGVDPRLDASPLSSYFSLKDVRNQARAAERMAIIDNEPLLSFSDMWSDFIEKIPELLAKEAKDLEYVAWYIEALTRTGGFRGLGNGFKIACLLIDSFWDELYPSPDEDGVDTRIAPLIGLNGVDSDGTLLMPISCIPLTEALNGKSYSLWEYEQALDIDRLEQDKRQQKIASGGISLKDVTEAVNSSSSDYYSSLYIDMKFALEQFEELSDLMDKVCGTAVPTSRIAKKLKACLGAVDYLAKDKLLLLKKDEEESNLLEPTPEVNSNTSESEHLGVILNSRSDAIKNLKLIADFFKRTEPHSPMAYGIEQVIRWSAMPLPDLLEELISDGDAREGYFRLVGIVPKSEQ
ncbi:type VI secretion system protein TssA [Vibrio nereis]|uniref:type VI secretion system protein TssA n=1 Tax=Vibrio nereis TaxID=693 RepID=UPI002494597A|nr:type VI secretion system protein TssA [Vibrio nereis]